MNKHLKLLVKKNFGSGAAIKRRLFGGFRIKATVGEVEFKNCNFEIIAGGRDMYRATLLFAHERWGIVKVTGAPQHVMACMAHGKELGVDVVPQGETQGAVVWGLAAGFAIVGCFWGMFFGLLFGDPLEGGLTLGAVTGVLAKAFLGKVHAKDVRRAGQQYRDIFPEIHGSERRGNRDAAREKGLL